MSAVEFQTESVAEKPVEQGQERLLKVAEPLSGRDDVAGMEAGWVHYACDPFATGLRYPDKGG
jgi:hypothetical protein